MVPEIAIVVSPRDWAERLHRFVADHGGARVRARILDGREGLDEGYQVLVAEDLTSFLTPRLMDEIRRSGRRVLGAYDPVEPWGRDRLVELGVDDTIEMTSSPEQFLRAIEALALTADVDLDAELQRLEGWPARGATTTFERPGADGAPDAPDRRQVGTVTVVGGPAGGPGVTELCIGLAGAARRHGRTAVLVDADEVAPSVAQRLALPLHPNVRTAIDVVEHWSGQLADTLVPVAGGGFEVLSGLPNTADWSELRPGEVVDVITELARLRQHVLVNLGHRLEELGGLGGASRYGVSRTVIGVADTVVGVCAATPVGLARYLEWVADVRALTRLPIHTVINRAPTSAFKRGELEDELRRTYAPPTLGFLPDDKRVSEAAWAGEPVTSTAFVKAVDAIAADVLVAAPGTPDAAPRTHAGAQGVSP
jgi:MinD-like ATPase involved in chromosome partitioning or flagellar assembly